uniref:(California timema) hypothetical protein n=1 Tax=Timema californicum TaxID=61474 RepID=A0A7R9J0Z5_TIMCA|nr:unnamed protein product [Timema californicum]
MSDRTTPEMLLSFAAILLMLGAAELNSHYGATLSSDKDHIVGNIQVNYTLWYPSNDSLAVLNTLVSVPEQSSFYIVAKEAEKIDPRFTEGHSHSARSLTEFHRERFGALPEKEVAIPSRSMVKLAPYWVGVSDMSVCVAARSSSTFLLDLTAKYGEIGIRIPVGIDDYVYFNPEGYFITSINGLSEDPGNDLFWYIYDMDEAPDTSNPPTKAYLSKNGEPSVLLWNITSVSPFSSLRLFELLPTV